MIATERVLQVGLLAFALPAVLVFSSSKVVGQPALLLPGFVLLYASLRLAALPATHTALLRLTFWVFVYVFLAAAPLLQILRLTWSQGASYPADAVFEAYLVVIAGIVAYDIGIHRAPKSSKGGRLVSWILERELSKRRLVTLSLISLIAVPALIWTIGGPEVLFLSRAERFESLLTTAAGSSHALVQLQASMISVLPLVCAVGLAYVWLKDKFYGRKVNIAWFAPLLLSVFVLNLLVNNPISSARYIVGTMALALLFIWCAFSKIRLPLFATAVVAGVLFLFPFLDVFRTSLDPGSLPHVGQDLVTVIAQKGDFDALQQIVNAVRYVESQGLTLGKQLAGTVFFWVPREWWQEKPLASGVLLAAHYGYENVNLSLPLWGELFLDGHIFAVAIGFYFYGLLSGGLERHATAGRAVPGFTTVGELLALMLAAYQIFLLRGTLLVTVAYFTPIALFLLACSKSVRPAAELDSA